MIVSLGHGGDLLSQWDVIDNVFDTCESIGTDCLGKSDFQSVKALFLGVLSRDLHRRELVGRLDGGPGVLYSDGVGDGGDGQQGHHKG